ncbi:hypothetical protein M3194_05130 [Paenibacillus glycanilyticus]|nr:hypothetical protein [Paenibacillus glycanilyticus]
MGTTHIDMHEDHKDKNDRELRKEAEECERDSIVHAIEFKAEERKLLSDITESIREASLKIEENLDVQIKLEALEEKQQEFEVQYQTTIQEKISEHGIEYDKKLEKMEERMKETLKEIKEAQEKVKNKGTFFTRHKFISFVIGVGINVAALAAAFITAIYAIKKGNEKAKIPGLSDEEMKYIRNLVEQWRNLDDRVFWSKMAQKIKLTDWSIDCQIYFMTYIKQLSLETKYPGSSEDKVNKVNELVDLFDQTKDISTIYTQVASFIYTDPATQKDVYYSRFIAADLCQLALNEIRIELKMKESRAETK